MAEGAIPVAGRWPLLVGGAALAIGGLAAAAWWFVRRQRAGSIPARLRRAAEDLLSGVLIPHVEGGQIHLEHVILTRQGIVVVDLRDAAGHVFGSESMQEWTVLARNQRYTFANPLPALYDRLAAVRRLVPDVPVRGLVVFKPGAIFSKGFPPNVALLDGLLEEIGRVGEVPVAPAGEALADAWRRLRREAVNAPH